MKIFQGDSVTVLKELEPESIDTVYTCPSPFGYYGEQPNKIGGENGMTEYINDLMEICKYSIMVLKPTGNLFIQIPDVYTPHGNLASIPTYFETSIDQKYGWLLMDRLIWHRTEKQKRKFEESGFLKNYEFIFHYVKDPDQYYFNGKSKWNKTSVFSYPLEDTYYTNEFDSGLPEQLTELIIDTTVPKNGIILDPLCGSAKVGVVAKRMNRDFIGIDIDPQIVELCKIRLGLS